MQKGIGGDESSERAKSPISPSVDSGEVADEAVSYSNNIAPSVDAAASSMQKSLMLNTEGKSNVDSRNYLNVKQWDNAVKTRVTRNSPIEAKQFVDQAHVAPLSSGF